MNTDERPCTCPVHWRSEADVLRAQLAERDAEIERLRAVAEYGEHQTDCYALYSMIGEAAACKCGFYQARAALAGGEGGHNPHATTHSEN